MGRGKAKTIDSDKLWQWHQKFNGQIYKLFDGISTGDDVIVYNHIWFALSLSLSLRRVHLFCSHFMLLLAFAFTTRIEMLYVRLLF